MEEKKRKKGIWAVSRVMLKTSSELAYRGFPQGRTSQGWGKKKFKALIVKWMTTEENRMKRIRKNIRK